MYNQGLYFVPLGGSGQFGANLNVYICDNDYLAVDCGIELNKDHNTNRTNVLVPDPQFLEKHKKNLKGLVLTHAHLDHIGAVRYLWDRLQCPIYTTQFTSFVLGKNSKELKNSTNIKIVKDMQTIDIGSFSVQFIPVSHSVPSASSLHIKTKYGAILHSGDWNLDPNPGVGSVTNIEAFQEAGNEGILAYVGDSTNAGIPGISGFERDVQEGLTEEFKNHAGRVIVATFSSHTGRVASILRAAEKSKRKAVMVSNSLESFVSCAKKTGYMRGLPHFFNGKTIESTADKNLVIIVTGSQGEHESVLSRMAYGQHKLLNLSEKDKVIFSSRAIPGNESDINDLKTKMEESGIEVLVSNDSSQNTLHVSGHSCQEEIKRMLEWLRPQIVIPVHGEETNLNMHAAFSEQCGVSRTIVPHNGSLIRLAPGEAGIVDGIEAGRLVVDRKTNTLTQYDAPARLEPCMLN